MRQMLKIAMLLFKIALGLAIVAITMTLVNLVVWFTEGVEWLPLTVLKWTMISAVLFALLAQVLSFTERICRMFKDRGHRSSG